MEKRYKVGLCLSGGAALGFAHIGALRALEEHDIDVHMVSGASFGAIVGALYSNGYSSEEILDIVEKYKLYNIFNIFKKSPFNASGISSLDKIEKILIELIPHKKFEGLKRKFYVSLVDITIPEWEIVDKGDHLIQSILASMSIPVIFEPEEYNGKVLVDGGVMNNLPVEPLVGKCDMIIGIDVQHIGSRITPFSKLEMGKRYYAAMMKEMQKYRVKECHHHIWFDELGDYSFSDFKEYKKIIDIGYEGTLKYIQNNLDLYKIKN